MSEYFLFPRLPTAAAEARLASVSGKAVADLTRIAATQDATAVFGATGGARVQERILANLRSELVRAATELGFPNPSRKDITMSFDPIAAGILSDGLPISPGEASRDDVWAFLTLVLLPDIATWRFPDQQRNRLLGGTRNAFQRLWWRAQVLRDSSNTNDPIWLLRLPEDALVGLMERPALSSNPRVAVTIGRTIHALAAQTTATEREDAWRSAYKRIRQRLVLVSFDFLPDEDLRAVIRSTCNLK